MFYLVKYIEIMQLLKKEKKRREIEREREIFDQSNSVGRGIDS